MNKQEFVNECLEEGIKIYLDNENNEDSLSYNSFFCSIIRMLVIIYDDVINCYRNNDMNAFKNLIIKYGYNEFDNFIIYLDKYYNFDKKQNVKAIKKKNKYFNLVQKCLIDMLICKNNIEKLDKELVKGFYNLLYTAYSKDFYKKSVALLLAYNPYEIDTYFKKMNLLEGES